MLLDYTLDAPLRSFDIIYPKALSVSKTTARTLHNCKSRPGRRAAAAAWRAGCLITLVCRGSHIWRNSFWSGARAGKIAMPSAFFRCEKSAAAQSLQVYERGHTKLGAA